MSPLNPLNPATGDVPVPEDQREIDAALRAGRISHRIFPYVDWRYGERGRRFTQSDSAWLAWLTRHSQERVYDQIVWLRNVLSNRGMPSSILEAHIRVLYRQLKRTIPDKERQYSTLSTSASRLRDERLGRVSSERCQELVEKFAHAFEPKRSAILRGAAHLLVASVADEKLGVKHAVKSLRSWLDDLPGLREIMELRDSLTVTELSTLDSEPFARRWPTAIETTISDARQT